LLSAAYLYTVWGNADFLIVFAGDVSSNHCAVTLNELTD